jgi:uncharacterized membrane protein YcaP (DUF421 family)
MDLLGLNSEDLEWYQMAIRGVIVFFSALVFIRIAGMRSFGNSSAFDVVLNITIGAILSRCITGHYPFFSCLLTAGILSFCHRITAFATSRIEGIRKAIEGVPINLFENGHLKRDVLKKFCISEEDIRRTLREKNIDNLSKAQSIWYETDGSISVVKRNTE